MRNKFIEVSNAGLQRVRFFYENREDLCNRIAKDLKCAVDRLYIFTPDGQELLLDEQGMSRFNPEQYASIIAFNAATPEEYPVGKGDHSTKVYFNHTLHEVFFVDADDLLHTLTFQLKCSRHQLDIRKATGHRIDIIKYRGSYVLLPNEHKFKKYPYYYCSDSSKLNTKWY